MSAKGYTGRGHGRGCSRKMTKMDIFMRDSGLDLGAYTMDLLERLSEKKITPREILKRVNNKVNKACDKVIELIEQN